MMSFIQALSLPTLTAAVQLCFSVTTAMNWFDYDAALLKTVGEIAGIGGLALGVFLILFRAVLTKLPRVPSKSALEAVKLFMWLTFAIAALGIAAWIYSKYHHDNPVE